MKKRLLPVAVLATAAFGLTACAGGSTGGVQRRRRRRGPELNVWIMQGTNPDAEAFFDEVATASRRRPARRSTSSSSSGPTPTTASSPPSPAAPPPTSPRPAPPGPPSSPTPARSRRSTSTSTRPGHATTSSRASPTPAPTTTSSTACPGTPACARSSTAPTCSRSSASRRRPRGTRSSTPARRIKAAHPDMIAVRRPRRRRVQVYPWVWGAGGEVATLDGDTWTRASTAPSRRRASSSTPASPPKHGFSSAGATTWKETDVLDYFAAGQRRHGAHGLVDPRRDRRDERRARGQVRRLPIPGEDGGIAPSVLGGSHLCDVRDGREQGPRLGVRQADDHRRVRRSSGPSSPATSPARPRCSTRRWSRPTRWSRRSPSSSSTAALRAGDARTSAPCRPRRPRTR